MPQVIVVGSTADFLEVRRRRMAHGGFLPPGEMDRGAAVPLDRVGLVREKVVVVPVVLGRAPLVQSASAPGLVGESGNA